MSEMTPDETAAAARGRRTILLIAAACLAPVIASYAVYYLYPRSAQVNYGTLLPTARRRRSAGRRTTETPFRLEDLRGRWVLIVAASAAGCDAGCERIALRNAAGAHDAGQGDANGSFACGSMTGGAAPAARIARGASWPPRRARGAGSPRRAARRATRHLADRPAWATSCSRILRIRTSRGSPRISRACCGRRGSGRSHRASRW